MIIYIELLIILGIMLTFLIWSIWYNITTKKLRRQYDKQRRTKEERRGVPDFATELGCSPGFTQPTGRQLLQTTEPILVGKNSRSNRKVKRIDRILGRRK